MRAELDYLAHLARDSARFVEALQDVPSDRRVPSCPDWDADDLLWHLSEVQWFWGTIVRERLDDPAKTLHSKPERPAGRADLEEFYRQASRDLADVLATTPPETDVWTWSSDHSAGFVRRRQAHEALIHRVDAELCAEDRSTLDPALSADGVDEILRVMHGGAPDWATFTTDGSETIHIQTTDTGDAWLVTLGRFTGTDPDDDSQVDEAGLRVVDGAAGADAGATISGTAADIDCWLWRRPIVGELRRSGDDRVLANLESTIARGIE